MAQESARTQGDFSAGSVAKNILKLALPMIVAQLINVLYSVVDRIYIGHIPGAASSALTGVGLTFPIIAMIIAFANLFGMGGAPLFSIERGKGDTETAGRIMGNSFTMLVITGILLTIALLGVKEPLLYAFGASDATFPYADAYLTIYVLGSVFVMIGLGMNNFINAQGFGRKGMMTVLLGAVVNLLLDPLFIFVFNMGVQGAALATLISQLVSATWALSFLSGKKALLRLTFADMRIRPRLVLKIMALGLSGFIMSVTNGAVQIVSNATLAAFGGDLYVGAMTIINSVREVTFTPINGLTSASQPVLGYNYGAGEYGRVKKAIGFTTVVCVIYTLVVWGVLLLFPRPFITIFTSDAALIEATVPAMHIYFFGFFMMAFQMAGQSTAIGLGRSKQAVFFSLLRKAFIVIPLTIILPNLFSLGVNGVFLAEPISNFIGGAACYITMIFTIWKELGAKEKPEQPE